ncbi:hypothetical protein FQN57_000798 [Myotisia sp. PD_48]|nr:hypothetical protein FQN57_000798 [Myotisia sp. PD_48]
MGVGASKPATGQGKPTKHVFTSETPVQFSAGLVESLQSSSETDSSRLQTIELHIQSRVAEELERIRSREAPSLADLEKRIADSHGSAKKSPGQIPTGIDAPLSLESPRVPFAGYDGLSAASAAAAATAASPSSPSSQPYIASDELNSGHVSKEIEALRQRLASRPTVRKLDAETEKAREDVVRCLRDNEARPLDCWQEVDVFKKEVARLERAWVQKVIT